MRALTQAGMHRLHSGASHPSWPWLYEFTAAFLRTAAIDFDGLAIDWARGQVSPRPFALLHKLALREAWLAGRRVDIHEAKDGDRDAPTVLYLHGGGYVTCSPRSHRDTIARIAYLSGARVVAPFYRLAPEHPFPAGLDDVSAVYRALLAEGVSPDRLILAGDSAGGGLALALLLRLRDAGEPLPRAVALISPWVDLALSQVALAGLAPHDYLGPSSVVKNATAYAGMHALTHPQISPVHADLSGLPTMLVQTGGWELLREQNERLVARARASGVSVQHRIEPGMLHAYTCFAGILPQGRVALAEIGSFVRSQAALPPRARDDGPLASAHVA